MKRSALLFLFSVCLQTAIAQTGKEAILPLLKALQQTYTASSFLSFDIMYRYAPESSPKQYEDSMSGQVKISGKHHWMKLANTETISTDDCMIALFKDDQVMFLSRPLSGSGTGVQSSLMGGAGALWISAIDSLLSKTDEVTAKLEESSGTRKLIIEYLKPTACKSMTFIIDKRTGLLSSIVSVVHARQLYDVSVQEKVTGDTFVNMEANFSNYSKAAFDAGLFNSNHYFYKRDGKYVCTETYQGYSVYLGSSGL